MNIFLKIITSLGFLAVIIQFLGIPHTWKEVATVVVGLLVMIVAFLIDRITLFIQRREDERGRSYDDREERAVVSSRPRHSVAASVSAFSTPLSTVTDAFSEVAKNQNQSQNHSQPHSNHVAVPQSHVHVHEMAQAFQKHASVPAPVVPAAIPVPAPVSTSVSASTSTPVPAQTPVSPPVGAAAPSVVSNQPAPTPTASKPIPQPVPQPIRASRYSSTPLSSLHVPVTPLTDPEEKQKSAREEVKESSVLPEKKKVTKKAKKGVSSESQELIVQKKDEKSVSSNQPAVTHLKVKTRKKADSKAAK